MLEGISSIEITFGEPVKLTREQQIALTDVIDKVCAAYEAEHPDRVMWTAGFGVKLMCHPMMINDNASIPFDDSVFSIECMERERYDTERCSPPQPTPGVYETMEQSNG